MTVLNDAVHFRGEVITFYATFKQPTGGPAGDDLVPFSPVIRIEFANSLGQLLIILEETSMQRISTERYFFNWSVPTDAALTTYNAVMSGILGSKEVLSTQEFIIGNPALTAKREFLRYGQNHSFLQTPRTTEPRLHPQLPQGEF